MSMEEIVDSIMDLAVRGAGIVICGGGAVIMSNSFAFAQKHISELDSSFLA